MLTINTNIASLNAQRNLGTSQNSLNTAMSRLSSGLRINSAADDAAGLAISEGMKGQVRSMNQAVRNANDGVSLAQTAEGALNEISNILGRMRELATQSSTGTIAQSQRSYINNEFQALASEITRIASATNFNGIHMLNGVNGPGHNSTTIQVGTGTGGFDKINIRTSAATASFLLGGVMQGTSPGTPGAAGQSIDTSGAAKTMQDTLDSAISKISAQRANLGAVQNRFQSVINNLQVSSQNTTAAQSRITDTDIAAETANLTRAQIMNQAGISILSQANQLPQTALKLLG